MIQPGTLLQNRYRVAEQIGKGGMGEVYAATDERFQSKVAIKRTFCDDPELLKAFGREARLLNRLRHAALPKVSDHFTEDGDQFLVMEYIEGSDLSELLKRRKVPFPLADVLRWADELLDALEYLHTQQPPVVHRDIKPQNISLTTHGKIVLLDFGLAKGLPAQTASGTASSVFGYSLNFAPLEQMQGTGTDPRSDLYSLAATLYYLLTAVRPTDALTRAAAAVKQQPDPQRPAHLVQPQVPAAVGQVLHRAMSQNAALRHASAAALRAALRQAAGADAAREARSPSNAANALRQSPSSHAAATAESSLNPRGPGRASTRFRPQTISPSQSLQPSSPSIGETDTVMDSPRRAHLSDSYTVPARGAAAKRTVGLVAGLLVVCAAAGVFLLARASVSRAPSSGVNNEVQNPLPASQQINPAEQTQPAASVAASDSSHAAPGPDASEQSAPSRTAGETTASNSQAAQAAVTPNPAGQNAGGATPDGGNAATAGPSSGGRPALVIQNPAPAQTPADESRRAEEPRREQPAPRPEEAYRPPPGYPPPPGDRRPPPPDGRRPPPDGRRPPFP
jgi:serine/threonine protein kinase